MRSRASASIPPLSLTVREAAAADRESIRAVHTAAFGRAGEAGLVDRLIDGGDALVSLIAEENGEAIGHVLFSKLSVTTDDGRAIAAASLAPLAVVPDRQRRGIGEALTREGLERLRSHGIAVVIVLGHPDYYPRFGFSAELARALRGPFSGPAWMAAELEPNALRGVTAAVRYPAAFGLGDA